MMTHMLLLRHVGLTYNRKQASGETLLTCRKEGTAIPWRRRYP